MEIRGKAVYLALALTAGVVGPAFPAGNQPAERKVQVPADPTAECRPTETGGGAALSADALAMRAQRCRDLRQYNQALELYRLGQQRFPASLHFRIREAMTLADAGRYTDAAALAATLVKRHPDNPDTLLAMAYVASASGEAARAMRYTGMALDKAPERAYVIREHVMALKRAGLAQSALDLAANHPGLIDAALMRTLEADTLAEQVRLAAAPGRGNADRFAVVDRALVTYDQRIAEWSTLGPVARPDIDRLETDRLLALQTRGRPEAVVRAYETMRRRGQPVADYALGAVASAYLQLRQPERAIRLYRQALLSPHARIMSADERLALDTGLYYALLESGDTDGAQQHIARVRDEQPVWRRQRGVPTPLPNELRLQAESTWALGHLYVNDTVSAQAELERLVARAPTNMSLRVDLASVYRARGWTDRAQEELNRVQAAEPWTTGLLLAQTEVAMDRQSWREAKELLDTLRRRAPEHPGTQRLERRWDTFQKGELRVRGNLDRSSGSPVTGDGDHRLETLIYSAPIDLESRLYAGVGMAAGDFPEGRLDSRWWRAGWEWRQPDTTVAVEATALRFDGRTRPGARIAVQQRLSDHWSVEADLRWRDVETPIRALGSGTTMSSAQLATTWRRDERGQWTFAVKGARFTDGNRRLAAMVYGRERLYTTPTLGIDAELSLYTSRNSSLETNYYNPRADLEVVPGLRFEHTLYQRYERKLVQTLQLGAGWYAQRGYRPGAVGLAGWGLRYQHSDDLEIGASVTAVSHPYDGERNTDLRFLLDLTWRF